MSDSMFATDSFKAGEVVCRQGEFGSTAFYVQSGSCDVFISTPIAHVEQLMALLKGGR